MNKIKVALCGHGYWGKNILRTLLSLSDIEVIGVCDSNEKERLNLNKIYPNLIVSDNYLNILNKIDALFIATPPETHYAIAEEALLQEKHVFIEKPMTTDSFQAQRLVYIAEETELKLMTGHTFCYIPAINDIKKLINNGDLGKIYYIDFIMTNLGKYQKDNILWDLAPHGISLILYLLNNPKIKDIQINGISAIQEELLDIAYLTLYFEYNFANIHLSWLNPNKERRLTIVGSKKMIVFDDIEPLEKIRIYDKGITENKTYSSWGESIIGYRHGDIVIPNTSTGEPLKIELQHFINCIIQNKTPITDGKNGLKIVEVIEYADKQLSNK